MSMDRCGFDFNKISVVPTWKEIIAINLSPTQHRTRPQVHKVYCLSRLRQFYTRKVKCTQHKYHDKLSTIIDEFPRSIRDLHLFYRFVLDMCYRWDCYDLVLRPIIEARKMIATISEKYVKLLTFADSLHHFKSLKSKALNLMCKVIKRISPSLDTLEKIRQHMAKLPLFNPRGRNLLICGCPNVGKSSFFKKITTGSDVDHVVTATKSLFVGHTYYNGTRYQVIDTPGILDKDWDEFSDIETYSLCAIYGLKATALFFLDISGSCGYSIAQQAKLFKSLEPPLSSVIVVCSEIDLKPFDRLCEEDKKLIMDMKKQAMGLVIRPWKDEEKLLLNLNALDEENVMALKDVACETANRKYNVIAHKSV